MCSAIFRAEEVRQAELTEAVDPVLALPSADLPTCASVSSAKMSRLHASSFLITRRCFMSHTTKIRAALAIAAPRAQPLAV